MTHSDNFTSVVWSPDGRSLASGSEDNTILVRQVGAHGELDSSSRQVLAGCRGEVSYVAWSTGVRSLASGRPSDNAALVWRMGADRDLASSSPQVLDVHQGMVILVVWSPDGRTLTLSNLDSDGAVILCWRMGADGKLGSSSPQLLTVHSYGYVSSAWSPDGRALASWYHGFDNTVLLWRMGADREFDTTIRLELTHIIQSMAYAPDGRSPAAEAWDKTVLVWRIGADGQPLGAGSPHPWHRPMEVLYCDRISGMVAGWALTSVSSCDDSTVLAVWRMGTGGEPNRSSPRGAGWPQRRGRL